MAQRPSPPMKPGDGTYGVTVAGPCYLILSTPARTTSADITALLEPPRPT
ncbi:MAG: hypothetical protein AAFX99_29575 [Myxococcota bacterium]